MDDYQGNKGPSSCRQNTHRFDAALQAEVIAFDELKALDGDMVKAKEKGLIRQEGKEYVMKDGDVVFFKFNV